MKSSNRESDTIERKELMSKKEKKGKFNGNRSVKIALGQAEQPKKRYVRISLKDKGSTKRTQTSQL